VVDAGTAVAVNPKKASGKKEKKIDLVLQFTALLYRM
jgi:hypothetical protein